MLGIAEPTVVWVGQSFLVKVFTSSECRVYDACSLSDAGPDTLVFTYLRGNGIGLIEREMTRGIVIAPAGTCSAHFRVDE